LTVRRLEEMSSAELDRLDRDRTVLLLTVSPLEEHGPHLPVGVDAFTARHLAETVAERLVAARPGWTAVLAPTLHMGTFAFHAPGTITMRQRVVRDAVTDYGESLARAGFRYIFVANGHGGPGHLVALDEASATVSRRRGVVMASLAGPLAWQFLRADLLSRVEEELGRPLTAEERAAAGDDTHAGLWETSLMLWLRPELVDPGYRSLPRARYSMAERLHPNYPLRGEGQGYRGSPALADPSLARAAAEVLMREAMRMVEDLLDGRATRGRRRSPFFLLPPLRTNFWPGAALAMGALAAWLWYRGRTPAKEEHP
jgi:creatinine amidohydrolase